MSDDYSGNYQERSEIRVGNVVRGHYALLQPDGDVRHVKYIADKHGFKPTITMTKH